MKMTECIHLQLAEKDVLARKGVPPQSAGKRHKKRALLPTTGSETENGDETVSRLLEEAKNDPQATVSRMMEVIPKLAASQSNPVSSDGAESSTQRLLNSGRSESEKLNGEIKSWNTQNEQTDIEFGNLQHEEGRLRQEVKSFETEINSLKTSIDGDKTRLQKEVKDLHAIMNINHKQQEVQILSLNGQLTTQRELCCRLLQEKMALDCTKSSLILEKTQLAKENEKLEQERAERVTEISGLNARIQILEELKHVIMEDKIKTTLDTGAADMESCLSHLRAQSIRTRGEFEDQWVPKKEFDGLVKMTKDKSDALETQVETEKSRADAFGAKLQAEADVNLGVKGTSTEKIGRNPSQKIQVSHDTLKECILQKDTYMSINIFKRYFIHI